MTFILKGFAFFQITKDQDFIKTKHLSSPETAKNAFLTGTKVATRRMRQVLFYFYHIIKTAI